MSEKKISTKQIRDGEKGMKPGWEITFVAENILVQTLAIYIAQHDGELPSEKILHKMTESCVKGSMFFDTHKKKYGIHDRMFDNINEQE